MTSAIVMKIIFFTSICLGLAMMLTSCCHKTEDTDSNKLSMKLRSFVLSKSMGDALTAKILLREIREGRITNAIETLEFSIDCSIVEMESSTNCDAATQQQVLQTLQLLKEYRQKYPRKNEAVIVEGDELKQNLKTTQEAEEFLEHVR